MLNSLPKVLVDISLINLSIASSLLAPQLVKPAEAQQNQFNTRDTRTCRSQQDLKTLAGYINRQKSFGVTPEGVNNWRSNGLQVPQATTPQSVLVSGDVMIRTNGLQVLVRGIDVTLPFSPGANNGDTYNLAAKTLMIRGSVYAGCINTFDKNNPFQINPNYDFAWQNVRIDRLNNQTQQSSQLNDGIYRY